MNDTITDIIRAEEAHSLAGLFRLRAERSPECEAYRQYDRSRDQWVSCTWREVAGRVARWREALRGEALAAGERVAILLNNGVEWVCMDQAALSLGLVPVPRAHGNPGSAGGLRAESGIGCCWRSIAGGRTGCESPSRSNDRAPRI